MNIKTYIQNSINTKTKILNSIDIICDLEYNRYINLDYIECE